MDRSRNYSSMASNHEDNNNETETLLPRAEVLEDPYTHRNLTEQMWTMQFIGLYAQYAALGLLIGSAGVCMNFCVYTFKGSTNLCTNTINLISIPWSFKVFYAVITDSYRPFGMRRKPYIVFGWFGVLSIILLFAMTAEDMTASSWIGLNMVMQLFLLIADVPADGFLVELSQRQSTESRGIIIATAQLIKFIFIILSASIQTVLMNGPKTNAESCLVSWSQCWSFGLSIRQYYSLLFTILFLLFVPMVSLQELDTNHIPMHSIREFAHEIWDTLKSLTAFYLIIFVIGIHLLAHLPNQCATMIQYFVIRLTSAQTGLNTIFSALAAMLGLWTFVSFYMSSDWRRVNFLSCALVSLFNLLWVLVFYNTAGLMNAWFTIFINIDQSFVAGLARILFSMAVVEIAKPGQEATTYELLISISNACGVLSGVLATQLLGPTRAIGCTNNHCPSNTVNLASRSTYVTSHGPDRFTSYTFYVVMLNILGTVVFTQFLPSNRQECHEWNRIGSLAPNRDIRGYIAVVLSVFIVLYGIGAGIALLNDDTSCLRLVGGPGC